jgi:hypothetical protein
LYKIAKSFQNFFVSGVNLDLQLYCEQLCLLINEFRHPSATNLLLHLINFREDNGHLGLKVLVSLMRVFHKKCVFCVLNFKVDNLVLVLGALLKEAVD